MDNGHSTCVTWCLTMVFICILLIASDPEHFSGVGHLYFFIWKMSIEVLYPFLHWIFVVVFVVEFFKVADTFRIVILHWLGGLQIFCPILLDVCSLYDHFLYCAKASEFHIVQLFSFDFVPHAFEVLSKKLYPTPGSWSVSPVFSFNNFIVLGLKFRSLIHLELIFVHTW